MTIPTQWNDIMDVLERALASPQSHVEVGTGPFVFRVVGERTGEWRERLVRFVVQLSLPVRRGQPAMPGDTVVVVLHMREQGMSLSIAGTIDLPVVLHSTRTYNAAPSLSVSSEGATIVDMPLRRIVLE